MIFAFISIVCIISLYYSIVFPQIFCDIFLRNFNCKTKEKACLALRLSMVLISVIYSFKLYWTYL